MIVWCALLAHGFFEENDKAIIVTSEHYIQIIEVFFLKLEEMDVKVMWFQQNGTMAHTAQISVTLLYKNFPERLISLRGDLQWPVCSLDLVPCDYFVWGGLKSVGKLKNNIHAATSNIDTYMLDKVD